jgi:hypothetical protein
MEEDAGVVLDTQADALAFDRDAISGRKALEERSRELHEEVPVLPDHDALPPLPETIQHCGPVPDTTENLERTIRSWIRMAQRRAQFEVVRLPRRRKTAQAYVQMDAPLPRKRGDETVVVRHCVHDWLLDEPNKPDRNELLSVDSYRASHGPRPPPPRSY